LEARNRLENSLVFGDNKHVSLAFLWKNSKTETPLSF